MAGFAPRFSISNTITAGLTAIERTAGVSPAKHVGEPAAGATNHVCKSQWHGIPGLSRDLAATDCLMRAETPAVRLGVDILSQVVPTA